jgi:hypothetical protein
MTRRIAGLMLALGSFSKEIHMKRMLQWGVACALGAWAGVAQAAPMPVLSQHYVGECAYSTGCLVATPTWSTEDVTLSWTITAPANATQPWSYSYTLADGDGGALQKAISHSLLEVSPTIDDGNLASLFPSLPGIDEAGVEYWGDEGNSTPGIPSLLYGLKFTAQGGTVSFSFTTFRSPIWGDFYSKDGKNQQQDVYAYNSGFGTDPATSLLGITGWVPTPDTTGTPRETVPLPASAWLMLLGTAILGARRWCRGAA